MRALLRLKPSNLFSELQYNYSRTIIFITVLFLLITFPIITEPLSTDDHLFNPCLLSTGSRSIFEIGMGYNFEFSNNYMPIDDILSDQIIIDLDHMYDKLKDSSLRFASQDMIENHYFLSLFNVSAAIYITAFGLVTLDIPGSLIGVLANGNEIDETYSESINTYSKVFLETGLYAGYRLNNFQFGSKIGLFAPVIYSDTGAIETTLATDISTGTTTASANVNIPVYSGFNLTEEKSLTAGELLGIMNGLNVDIGATYMEKDKAILGIHLNNIPLKNAHVSNKMNISMSMTENINNPLSNFDENEEAMLSEEISDITVINMVEEKEISIPIELGVFYRMTHLPIIDVVFKGDLVFDDIIRYNLGIDVLVDFGHFPTVFMGFGYNRVVWELYSGIRQDFRIIEIGVDFGMTSPDIGSLFNMEGFSAKMFVAVGF